MIMKVMLLKFQNTPKRRAPEEKMQKKRKKSSISGSSKVKAQIGDKKNHVTVNEKLSLR